MSNSAFRGSGEVFVAQGGELASLGPWWLVGKRKGRQRHTQFMDASSETIARMARDRSLPAALRRKAQAEEKERKLRNRQKREGN